MEMPQESSEYAEAYTEKAFWEKLKNFALIAGKIVVEKAITLYYCLLDADTPIWAKGIIVASLGYFISPIDAIPDVVPVVGYSDDLGVLVLALAAVAAHIKKEHTEKATETLSRWFS